jgi:CBS domain-containing protein
MPEAKVRDVVTKDPLAVDATTSVDEVARIMRDHDIGSVLVTEGAALRGLATDRDVVVRYVAETDTRCRLT